MPQVRELIHDFHHSRYAACLAKLARMRPALLLDLHLSDHVAALYEAVRQKALIQYTQPFRSVDLRTMAGALNTPLG